MAGKENLVPQNKRTKEEQSEIARMGGKASGEARRRKRDAKKAAEFLLNLPAKGVVAENLTKVLDVEEEDQTNIVDFDLTCAEKNSTFDVIFHFPTCEPVDATIEEVHTSKVETIKNDSLIIKASFSTLFNSSENASVRIILKLKPMKSKTSQMAVFASSDRSTKITGESGKSITFDVKSSPIEYVLSEDKSYYIVSSLREEASEIVIPDTYKQLPVKKMAPNIFTDDDIIYNTFLETIVLGNNLVYLPEKAFKNCRRLKSVTIGSGLTVLPDDLFLGCHSLETITIPKGITRIPDSCFAYCESLSSIIFEGEITGILDDAFRECTSLKSINFTSALRHIGQAAFYGCTSLSSVIIEPNTHESLFIGQYAFGGCDSLTEVWLSLTKWYTASRPNDHAVMTEFDISSYEEAAAFLKENCDMYVISQATYDFWKD